MALKDQMEMNFGDVPDNNIGVDPVSGNDIPLGATAENVRDDIPANLSEGEIVVPADVVNFHGVKLFEDLREEAKRGYAQMAQDGRMGGEPMMENSDMMADLDIDLSVEDLQVMDDEEPVEMNRGGRSMADYRGVTKNRKIKSPKPSGPRKTHSQIMASIRGGKSPNDDKPSKPKPKPKPAPVVQTTVTQPSAPVNKDTVPTIGAQINFPGFEGTTVPSQPQSPNMGTTPVVNTNIAQRRSVGSPVTEEEELSAGDQIRAIGGNKGDKLTGLQSFVKGVRESDPVDYIKGLFGGGDKPDTGTAASGTNYNQSGSMSNLEGENLLNQTPFLQQLYQGFQKDKEALNKALGLKLNEGGLVNPEPFYSQKGGFDLSHMENTGTVVQEYMNDEGHRIYITFVDGVPQMEIPEGYYPVGEGVSLNTVVNSSIPTMDGISPEPVRSEGSDMGDDPSAMAPAPDPINYKELSIDELKSMVSDQKSMGTKIFAGLSPLTKIIMWDQTRRTKGEIERRIEDPNTSEVDKMRLNNLLELMNREEPGLVKTLLDKVTGKEFERVVSQIPKPVVPDVDYSDPTLAPDQGIYTPDPQEESDKKIPTVDPEEPYVPEPTGTANVFSDETIEAAKKISQEAAAKAFSTPGETRKPDDNDAFIASAIKDPASFLPPTPSRDDDDDKPAFVAPAPSYTRPSQDPYAEPGRPTTRRTGGGGRNKGGLMKKKKTNKKKSK